MILDCVTFFNEQTLWDLRFEMLRGIVDGFIVVSATSTHSGQPWTPSFRAPDDAPVSHLTVDLPDPGVAGVPATRRREMTQRNRIVDAVASACPDLADDAILLISDVDELPRPGLVAQVAEVGVPDGHILIFRQRLHYYDINTWSPDQAWHGTRAIRWSDARALTPHVARYGLANHDPHYPIWIALDNGGWHCSYFGGVDAIQRKMTAFLHQELVNDATLDRARIMDRIMAGRDLYDRQHGHRFVRGEQTDIPPPMRDDPRRWASFFAPEYAPWLTET